MSDIKIKRALIAVYDKTGIADFARALVDEFGIEIISTGGTAKHLKDAGIPVTMVEQVTGFPEMLDGRVKTLHPKIHAGILADRDNPEHMRQLAEHGITPIDMVVVNLYPFEKTVADPNCTFEQAIEMIDIGGPCMLRAAAKNHKHVLVVERPDAYDNTLMHMRQWRDHKKPNKEEVQVVHQSGALRGFLATARYDQAVSTWLDGQFEQGNGRFSFRELFRLHTVHYGENPHQQAQVHLVGSADEACVVPSSRPVGPPGRDESRMSFNNYVDGDAALGLVKELTRAGLVWHRFSTGDSSCHRFETGGQSADTSHVDDRLDDERYTRRNLPHIQVPGRTYFVTFRVQQGQLSPDERDIVLNACAFWHGKKATFHAIVVMPDHVHILLTPHETAPGQWVALGEILHSIKRHSAREVNQKRGVQGALWLDETFDRVMRDENEFADKWDYMQENPRTAGLPDAEGYQWFWRSRTGWQETIREENHRLETGATSEDHRLQTGATNTCAVAFIKHTNACGCAIGDDPIDTYRRAYLGDPIAAAGGVLCMNFPVTREIADTVMNSFGKWGKAAGAAFFKLDVWIAPSFDDDAVALITTPTEKRKWGKECRLLAVGDMSTSADPNELDYKKITGGMLVQTRDLLGLNEDQWKVVSKRKPTESEMADLRFAWLVCKHTKSNAITVVRDGALLGSGAGQMSRVKSCDLAIQLSRENGHGDRLKGAVAAGDAFFPVPDGPQKLIDAGITAIIHPGGSNRDAETVAAADAAGVAMIVTGTRHFKH